MEMLAMNLDALREVNPDVIGWITVPGTHVDYPLVQGADNDFYLDNTWKKEPNKGGAIFMEAQNSADMTDFNTIIYGHNMNDNSMFSDLEKYSRTGNADMGPTVYILLDNGVYRYDVFASYKANVKSIIYGMKVQTDKKRNEMIDFCLNYNEIRTDIKPTPDDRLLTLSTCAGFGQTARWVVVGVYNEEGSCLYEPLK